MEERLMWFCDLGIGSFGTVRIGCHRLTNTRVAIKQVPKSLPFVSFLETSTTNRIES